MTPEKLQQLIDLLTELRDEMHRDVSFLEPLERTVTILALSGSAHWDYSRMPEGSIVDAESFEDNLSRT